MPNADIIIAFATPNSSNGLDWDSGATSTLQTLVSSAHNSGYDTQVVLSIGGCCLLVWGDIAGCLSRLLRGLEWQLLVFTSNELVQQRRLCPDLRRRSQHLRSRW